MKKPLSVLATLLLGLVLVTGCNKKEATETSEVATETQEVTTEEATTEVETELETEVVTETDGDLTEATKEYRNETFGVNIALLNGARMFEQEQMDTLESQLSSMAEVKVQAIIENAEATGGIIIFIEDKSTTESDLYKSLQMSESKAENQQLGATGEVFECYNSAMNAGGYTFVREVEGQTMYIMVTAGAEEDVEALLTYFQ